MGVQLQIVPLDDATPASPEVVRLPQVRMIPTDENLPHLRSHDGFRQCRRHR